LEIICVFLGVIIPFYKKPEAQNDEACFPESESCRAGTVSPDGLIFLLLYQLLPGTGAPSQLERGL